MAKDIEFINNAVEKCFSYFENLKINEWYSTLSALSKFHLPHKFLWEIDTKVNKLIHKSGYKVEYPTGIIGIPYAVGCEKLSNKDGELFSKEQKNGFNKRILRAFENGKIPKRVKNKYLNIASKFNYSDQEIISKMEKAFFDIEMRKHITLSEISKCALKIDLAIIFDKVKLESIFNKFKSIILYEDEFENNIYQVKFIFSKTLDCCETFWKEPKPEIIQFLNFDKNNKEEVLNAYRHCFGTEPPLLMMTSYNNDRYQKLMIKALNRGSCVKRREVGIAFRGVTFDLKK